MENDQRKHYRINYTEVNCPQLLSSGVNFNVLDLSEEGLRFTLKNMIGFKLDDSVTGSITFVDGESFLVYGIVKRVSSGDVSLVLKRPIPLRKIVEEQRRLIQKTALLA